MSLSVLSAADLHFDPLTHIYTRPDGSVVPSVTQILAAVGVTADWDDLAGISHRIGIAIDLKREIGSATHADIHSFDDDDLVMGSVDPRVLPYLNAWIAFRANNAVTPIARERRVLNAAYGYCGTLDGIFESNGKRILIDVKLGDPRDAAAHLQLAAYEAAYLAEHPDEHIDARWAVRLCPDLTVPYRITVYSPAPERPDAWRDFQKFLACVTVYHEQPDRRVANALSSR